MTDWTLAACKGINELMFPERGESTDKARAVCAGCPISEPCREAGIADVSLIGIMGGMSHRERKAASRNRRAAA